MKLFEALDILTSTYQSLDAVALGLPVDAKEVSDELAKANPDSAEFVALTVLAKYNPYVKQDIPQPKLKVKQDVSTDQVE
jgi:hypothetical protein